MNWTPQELPNLNGKTYFITGGNSGIGYEASKILAKKGARIAIGARNPQKAQKAIAELKQELPTAQIDYIPLDLTDAKSIEDAAKLIEEKYESLDALVNNAGIMQTPQLKTDEGFELQLGTNHLGHFRLTKLLYPLLKRSGGRIAVVSSLVHHQGEIHFDDLMLEKSYTPTKAYAQSKLANLLFALELDRRLQAVQSPVTCIPCHPGYSATNLQSTGVGLEGGSSLLRWLYKITNVVMAQSAERGAYPLALAAADPNAQGGAYYGPTRFGDMQGPVGLSKVSAGAQDLDVAKRLWEETEKRVGSFTL